MVIETLELAGFLLDVVLYCTDFIFEDNCLGLNFGDRIPNRLLQVIKFGILRIETPQHQLHLRVNIVLVLLKVAIPLPDLIPHACLDLVNLYHLTLIHFYNLLHVADLPILLNLHLHKLLLYLQYLPVLHLHIAGLFNTLAREQEVVVLGLLS